MRSIDADAMIARLKEWDTKDNTDKALHNFTLSRINEQPTIHSKRGRWIYCEDSIANSVDGYRCDKCGFFVPWDYQHKSIDYIEDYNFCPNCGARMDGEQNG